ncbi:hypothetical protein NKR23_g10887 [Pleurostoma richardsiae]|uniref:Uncharacterized protein n=1 Tax=Pleurostoma richardsiae TaxID=41990 RepID=A0AA38VHY7_9PEZI|nr:hypothetical protein NKR23_g10887 [Pleurostoma richardsiae]
MSEYSFPLSKLSVGLRQASLSPPTIAIRVINTHSAPVTILTWESPLDPLALQLGLLSITPAGADTPLDLPTIKVSRKVPPESDSLITLEPGQGAERDVVLTEPLVPLDKLASDGGAKARVQCKGRWVSVWPSRLNDISEEALEKLGFGEKAMTGSFETEALEIETK